MEFIITDSAKEQLAKGFKGKIIRVSPKNKTWGGSSYQLVLDEPNENDNVYNFKDYKFIVSKFEEKDAPYLEIDFKNYYWGSEFVVTTFCWFTIQLKFSLPIKN